MIRRLLAGAIGLYQVSLGPLFGGSCRFQPTCSRYAEEAIRQSGAVRGLGAVFKRVLRCHPFHPAVYDPVVTIRER